MFVFARESAGGSVTKVTALHPSRVQGGRQRPQAFRPSPGLMHRFRSGNVTKVTALHPPFFFVLPKKNAPCTVEEKGAGRTLWLRQRVDRGSSQSAGRKLSVSAECAEHCANLVLLRRKSKPGWSTWCRIEKPLRVDPGVTLRYALSGR